MTPIIILTDIDGTLGRTDREILTSLGTLRSLGSVIRVSFVTGRSLTALRPMTSAILEGSLVSPWGGGNALRRTRAGYRTVWPLVPVLPTMALGGVSWVHVPRRGTLSHAVELMSGVGPGECPETHVCVGGYREATDSAAVPVGVIHAGLDGTRWDLVAPWAKPRRQLLRRMRRAGAGWIAYWGDAEVDAQALGEADLVLAPVGSTLSRHRRVSSYGSIEEALALTFRAALAPPAHSPSGP